MMNESPEVFYLDVQVSNINSDGQLTSTLAEYNKSRILPYLFTPEKYYGSIVQFNLTNTDAPILTMPIVPNQGNVNLSIYNIYLTYQTSTYTQPVIFIPQTKTAPIPPPPNLNSDGIQDNQFFYYAIYNYSYFAYLVNNALSLAWSQLKTDYPLVPDEPAPYIKFDPMTQLFSIYSPNNIFNQDFATPVVIYFNGPLYTLFSYFPSSTVNLNSLVLQEILINTNNSVVDSTGINILTQETSSINLFSQIISICITSQFLPVIRSQIFKPSLYYSNTVETFQNNNSQSQNILLEYSPPDNIYNKNLVYNPTAQYRVFELTGENPLFNLDFKFWYRTVFGNLEPIYLNSGTYLSLKIGFFRKDYYKKLKNHI
jgi:hypothetical protein